MQAYLLSFTIVLLHLFSVLFEETFAAKRSICADLGYNAAIFPNVLGHANAVEANMNINQFYPLLRINCSLSLKKVLCQLHFPECTAEQNPDLRPCRQLCLDSKNGCNNVLTSFGFTWPSSLECSQFPDCKSHEAAEKTTPAKTCVGFWIPMCARIGYNQTYFPNILGHQNKEEANLAINQFRPLLKLSRMSPLLGFLCRTFFPECDSGQGITPCRSLCQHARNECSQLMNLFGFQWPPALKCSLFPVTDCSGHVEITQRVEPSQLSMTTPQSRTCVTFRSPMCARMDYNQTYFPNIFGHENEEDAGLEINQFYPLIKIKCSPSLEEFLCRTYFPQCDSEAQTATPCRSLCQNAQNGCERIMNNFGFQWPRSLRCSRFPVSNCSGYVEPVQRVQSSQLLTTTPQPRTCVTFRSPVCARMDYNQTYFPNILSHENEEDAGLEVNQFYPLVIIKCSPSLEEFLCRTYFPQCDSEAQTATPCRSLCQNAQNGCERLMNRLGFQWPRSLRCSRFPVSNCSGYVEPVQRVQSSQLLMTTPQPPTFQRMGNAARTELTIAARKIEKAAAMVSQVKKKLHQASSILKRNGGRLKKHAVARATINNILTSLSSLGEIIDFMSA
ncbi:uncharacterized protein LOC143470150 isoform X2 [Clavelina lepadiformis]|uniref:uncharacterized protein LOC143470150 isoform X2 n=1 Tax=Clavelina lepadiformis TaxID=159417 RepID=UPI0040421DB5